MTKICDVIDQVWQSHRRESNEGWRLKCLSFAYTLQRCYNSTMQQYPLHVIYKQLYLSLLYILSVDFAYMSGEIHNTGSFREVRYKPMLPGCYQRNQQYKNDPPAPPTLSSLNPTANSHDAPVSSDITATFNETMNKR